MNNSVEDTLKESISPLYTLSVTSELSGVSSYSIRQYIDKGLIIPYKKYSKRHLFSDVDILRLRHIRKQLNEQGLNIAGIKALMALIPCWAIRSCSAKERNLCHAYQSVTHPCWEASEKGSECKNVNCRECNIYRIFWNNQNLKSLLISLIK